MRLFFHGNIRISPDFRSCAAIESAPQRLQIVALRKRLLHVDANAKHALLRAAVGDLAEEQPVALVDSHRPGAFQQNRFVLREAQSELARNEASVRAALRIFRPPLPARVELREKRPAVVICEGARRVVQALAGPFRSKGGWWSESPWARDEWDVLIPALRPKYESSFAMNKPTSEETALYRIYLDLRSNGWFVEGIYD